MADQGKMNLKKHKSFAISIDALINAAKDTGGELGGNLTIAHMDAKSQGIYENLKSKGVASITVITDPLEYAD